MSLEDDPVYPFVKLIDSGIDTVEINELFSTDPSLVLFYPSRSCRACVEKIIELLNEEIKLLGLKNIIMITDFSDVREYAVFCRINKIQFPVYNVISN